MRLTFDHLSEDERQALRARVADPTFREQMWLVANRVPYDLAMSADPASRRAMCVAFAEIAGVPADPETGALDFSAPRAPRAIPTWSHP